MHMVRASHRLPSVLDMIERLNCQRWPILPCDGQRQPVARLSGTFLLLVIVFALTGCTTPTVEIFARLPEHGSFVNGRESVQGNGLAFVMSSRGRMTADMMTVTEFDGKPFFIEYKSPVIWDNGKWLKFASPIALGSGGALVISPGKHTLRMKYQMVEDALLFKTKWTSDERTVEFIAEKGHGYEIEANMKISKGPTRSWAPTITDRDAKPTSK